MTLRQKFSYDSILRFSHIVQLISEDFWYYGVSKYELNIVLPTSSTDLFSSVLFEKISANYTNQNSLSLTFKMLLL